MIIENSYIETNPDYKTGIALEEYNGNIGIVACQEGKDGKIYARWVYAQKNKAPVEKPIPMKITLGDGEEAVKRLTMLRAVLLGGEPNGDMDSEIPF